MDETGCRLGEHLVSRDPTRTLGIVQVVEVWCTGTPTGPVQLCPCCASAP